MSLPDVLLSLLRAPMSGTELIELFEGSINHFWKTDLSQIYKALDALERDECVRSNDVPSQRGPARKVYELTPRGRRRLVGWIRRPPRVPPAKFEYLAQLFSATADKDATATARAILEGMRDEAVRSVQVLEAIDASVKHVDGYPDGMPSHVFYPWLTVRHGLYRRRAFVEWIEDSLERLERRSPDAPETTGRAAIDEIRESLSSTESDSGRSRENGGDR